MSDTSSDEMVVGKEAPILSLKERKKALVDKYQEIKLNLDWIERLDLTSNADLMITEIDLIEAQQQKQSKSRNLTAENEFKREIAFYKQAQSSALIAIPRLRQLNINSKRPEDYFAQMAKSDQHMKKVRQKLLVQETITERREKARKLRELKKYGKKVQVETVQKQQKEKREILEKIKKKKKLQSQSYDELFDGKRSKVTTTKGKPKKSIKKILRDKKYGFGGQKKRSKYNTAESSADVSSFRSKRGLGKKKKTNSRPGKSKRQQKRGKGKRL